MFQNRDCFKRFKTDALKQTQYLNKTVFILSQ